MDKLLVATRSKGKIREIRKLLGGVKCEVVFPDEIGIAYGGVEELIEDTDTYAGNAAAKAKYFARISGLPTLADDSGIEVDALDGRPGVFSRRYAAVTEHQDQANNRKMLEELAGVPRSGRTARYRCVVVYVPTPEGDPFVFEGTCDGRIMDSPDGEGGFGYDPIFYSADLDSSFGQATQEAKDAISHRGRAFQKFIEWMEKEGVGGGEEGAA